MNTAQKMMAAWLPLARVSAPRTIVLNGRERGVPVGAILPQPVGYPLPVRDKIGNVYPVWRGEHK